MSNWLDDFVGDLDKVTGAVTQVTGAVQNVVSAVPILKHTTTTETPAQGETTPKQAQVANDTTKASTFPWGVVIAAVVVLALVEWS